MIDVQRVNDQIVLLKLMLGETILTAVSVYAKQCGLCEEKINDKFYSKLTAKAGKLAEKEVVVVARDLNGHV